MDTLLSRYLTHFILFVAAFIIGYIIMKLVIYRQEVLLKKEQNKMIIFDEEILRIQSKQNSAQSNQH